MTNRRMRFKVPMPSPSKPQAKESEQVCNTVAQDRKYYMECTIVRIMKTRKVLKHNALIEEVSTLCADALLSVTNLRIAKF